ncbi:MAG TPA: HD domain-containing protein [archaeon]|nr:HD domain-containing protein [archaeon]
MKKAFNKELEEIKESLKKWHPHSDFSMLEEAFWLSENAHEGQYRKSEEPYFTHPVSVAKSLAEAGLDETVVSAGLLHDSIEDTHITGKQIKKFFGEEVYTMVEGLTKLDKQKYKNEQEYNAATTIKTILASYKNLRVLIIKLFDKLHNMRTIKYLPTEKQKRISADTLTIYVPLAHKLGMHKLKNELADLALKALQPKKYELLKKAVEKRRKEKSKEIKKAEKIIQKTIGKTNYKYEEYFKPVYDYYSKMTAQNKELKELNDLSLIKIIVPTTDDCYSTMGRVHQIFTPVPSKLKDYIAIPESNIYKALHLQVIGPEKKPIKIYIMTPEMKEIAENGIVYYQRNRKKNMEFIKQFKEKLKQPMKKAKSQRELAGYLDLDFHNNVMIVFTEQGNVISLPAGATALDFSFFQNEKKAPKSVTAIINGKTNQLWAELKSGDVVKIVYSKTSQMNAQWISHANSNKARNIMEKQIIKKPDKKNKHKLIKIRVESVDRIGLLSKITTIVAKNGLNIETAISKAYDDNTAFYTELFVTPKSNAKIQKAVEDLKKLKETINVGISYTK